LSKLSNCHLPSSPHFPLEPIISSSKTREALENFPSPIDTLARMGIRIRRRRRRRRLLNFDGS